MEEYVKTGSKAMKDIFLIFVIAFMLLFIYHKPKGFDTIYFTLAFLPLIYIVYYLHVRLFPMGEIQLIILSSFLAEMGLIMIYRVAPDLILKQIAWIFIGFILYFVSSYACKYYDFFYKVKYGNYVYLAISFILLFSTFVLGKEIGGSKNWLTFGSISVQPSEIVKIIYIIFLARYLKDNKTAKDIIKVGAITIVIVGILVIEKDLGTALLFYLTTTFMIFAATSSLLYTAASVAFLGFGGVISYFLFNHVRVRIQAWLNPWMDVPGKTYQIAQSLFAIGAGGFFGTGLGMGHPEYIPVVASDFIFSAISEEFGMLGSVAIILVYFVIMYRGIKVALDAKDDFGALIAVGLTSMFSLQVFTIIGGVIKFIPLTGVTLPFVSYGGSSMVMSFITLGMLNGIAVREDEDVEQYEPQH
ncbi:FtsW/RodA/SpoVE family cell cycle protein [Thermoanaerobacterium thermosaccharolyticum]|jgi:cell division protein FtsW (lipid II flippase)|uniref:Cell cycle protein n=1 Tax=Thermoanaerobacterium thermosaccharolyticum (strain ATCC 7956 / DSM 571 / NCIMB 9385 / NCA 3814 / NCTC 13789 / WDCM 00135 / 2032) TaxID=580327 RepID=D9TT48_THETC|nr:FtsW/RodA/SpoVE family cell cycle protein [Thermoanaerobacterium thermosaccharolyticum]ADL68190.1 cell cycle protein [Thermoanaerobacterium thermosaccharolyticum DSM 571]MBE0068393.1 FtsW/RodA/SpoVE family cell cycle protein [Thermoanaerobacterium thermosaccharolyticum]MBE0228398.1 FtsW/RodA/SpoVE family cell cycle protein [Thermoanaerobacterium thermosaccharolyticum]TCW38037.1 cell division protein FtsW (lipid II flippase) [Thermohydrogenium kirishiense]